MTTYRGDYTYLSTKEEYDSWVKNVLVYPNKIPEAFPCVFKWTPSFGLTHEYSFIPFDDYVTMLKSDYDELHQAVLCLEYDGYEFLELSGINR